MSLSLFSVGRSQFFDSNGDPLNGGLLYTYEPGTATEKAAYTDKDGTEAHANPIVLDARGEEEIWLDGAYKLVLKDSLGVTIWTADNHFGIGHNVQSGYLTKAVSSNVTLTSLEYINSVIEFTGSLTSNINVIVSDDLEGYRWILKNSTTGSYTLTFKTTSGTGVSVARGTTVTALSDTSNIVVTDASVATVSILRLTTPINAQRVYLKAHTTEGDGGHGWFRGAAGAAAGTYTDNGGTIIVPTGGDGSAALLRDFDGVVAAEMFGPITATTVQAAADWIDSQSGGVLEFNVPGTYTFSTAVELGDNTEVRIAQGVTIKLADGADTHVFTNKDWVGGNTGIVFSGRGKVDGNKANQTDASAARGIYLVNCSDSSVGQLLIADTEDHGVFFSLDGTQTGNSVRGTRCSGCGKNTSSVGGSGIAVTSGKDFIIDAPEVTGSIRAGIRFSGTGFEINGGVIDSCEDAGILPVSGSTSDVVINGTHIRNISNDVSGDGIRLVGVSNFQINGVISRDNDGSGVMVLNGCDHISINGGLYYNNGQNATARAAQTGRDGITVKNDGTANTHVTIKGAHCFDTQGSPTQDYGLAIEDTSDSVIYEGCVLEGNETQDLYLTSTATGIRAGGVNFGDTRDQTDMTGWTVTGTLVETDMASLTIKGNTVGARRGVRITGYGEASGTNGTKVVRVYFGATNILTISMTAAQANDWFFTAVVMNSNASAQRVSLVSFDSSPGVEVVNVQNTAINTASDVVVKCSGTLGDVNDSVIQRAILLEPVN